MVLRNILKRLTLMLAKAYNLSAQNVCFRENTFAQIHMLLQTIMIMHDFLRQLTFIKMLYTQYYTKYI